MPLHKSYLTEEAARSKFTYSANDTQQTEGPVASRTSAKVQRSTKHLLPAKNPSAVSRNRLKASSSASDTRSSANGPPENGVRRGNVTGTPYTARLYASTSSKPPSPLAAPLNSSRIPLLSGSSNENALGLDSTRKIVRREAPSVEQYVSSLDRAGSYTKPRIDARGDRRPNWSSKSLPEDFREPNARAFLGAAPSESMLPTMLPKRQSGELPPALIPELKALAAATASNRTATSTPRVPSVSSPSTQYSGSAGPWSSRDTTPTSISSCSPGVVQPSRLKTTSKLRRAIPSPHATAENSKFGVKAPPASADTFTSSRIENSAEIDRRDNSKHFLLQQYREKQRRNAFAQAAPKPPPRKSSVKSKSPQQATNAQDRGPEDSSSEHTARAPSIVEPLEEPVLNVAISTQDPLPGGIPRRPSRTGTADLGLPRSSVVQSNLSPQSLRGYRRRDSLDVASSARYAHDMALGRGTDIDCQRVPFSGVEHLRRPLPQEQIDSASKSSKLPVVTRALGSPKHHLTARGSSDQGTRETGRSTIDKISSRLGIFGRRSKVNREGTRVQEDRDVRKGPAAGTGHEGYGKYARSGRKHSVGSGNSSRERSTSTASRPSLGRKNSLGSAGGSDIDDFIAQRLQPVVISGGGGQDVRPDSDAPTVWPSFDHASFGSQSSLDLNRQLTSEPAGSVASDHRSMSATSVATDALSSIATDFGPSRLSRTFQNQAYPTYAPPSLDSYSTSQSSLIQDDILGASVDKHIDRPTLGDLKKASKTGKMFKWNLFRRKASTLESPNKTEMHGSKSMRMSVAVAPMQVQKSIPYYALMDSETDNDGENDLQDLLEQVYQSPSLVAETTLEPHGLGLRQQYGQSVLLPSMPALQQIDSLHARSSSPHRVQEFEVQPIELPSSISAQSIDHKPRRLPQVGRIPRVISRRDRQHKPAATSFSRPFQRGNFTDAPKRPEDHAASTADTTRPILGIHTDVLPSRPFSSAGSGQPASAPVGPFSTRPLGDFETHAKFILFPHRGGSGISGASSSGRVLAMANLPPSAGHRQHTEEDEIWNEYDDLLDHVMSPTSPDPGQSAGRPSGLPFSQATYRQSGEARPGSRLRLGALQNIKHHAHSAQLPSLRLPPSSPSTAPGTGYRLRRSRIVSALQSNSPLSPSSPFSTSNQTLPYSDQISRSADSGQEFSGANPLEGGLLPPSAHSPPQAFPPLPETSHHQSTALLDAAERDHEGPAGQSDLRFAALMTSRWLSFGRVLFSPAHDIVEASPGQQILVVDGLGNDDWSFFCAVTYPGAIVHDLKETDVAPGSRQEPPQDSWRAPPNYRRVEIANLAERFPFPQSYFATVVFRFPAAVSDPVFKMAFSECKRVLVPGGHLELSLLDLDIVNMGPFTRHAVRDLKARMIGADPEVSLKPVGDNLLNILGGRGFENLSRCVVGVPVAGKVATSSGSRSSRSSRDSYSQKGKETDHARGISATRDGRSPDSGRQQRRGGNFSLSELVSDHSATSDEKITKMVAKVGRWWYTRTYERAVLPGGDLRKSIWSDKKMLHECKARGSGFKLLIAYAQKPIEMRRRTFSEPIRPTAAVAGTRSMNHSDGTYRTRKTR